MNNKMKVLCLEGARGGGKSTVAFQLRQSIKNSTLINFTGFNLDGEEGLKNITNYYIHWMAMFIEMANSNIEQTIICDRIFFSEKVFNMYKSYDFDPTYKVLVEAFSKLNPTIFYLTVHNEEVLANRLKRDKIPFYKVEESVQETLRQQDAYDKVFKEVENKFNIVTIDTSYLESVQVKDIILSKI